MAKHGITNFFKGGTREQYENTRKAVHPNGGNSLPPGQTYHAAGETSDGILVVAIWESKETWEQFRDTELGPALGTLENGLPVPPETTEFEVLLEQT